VRIYKPVFVIMLAVILWSLPSQGFPVSNQDGHPIDKWVEEQIAKNPSTAGERDAYDQGSQRWDKEMNKIYRERMKQLDNHQQAALKNAQRNWLKFRDAESQVISQIIQKLSGTMWVPVPSARLYKINRQRALELKDYLDWTRSPDKD
jgi:uncharacterized protein YecT (DUF1311 family)